MTGISAHIMILVCNSKAVGNFKLSLAIRIVGYHCSSSILEALGGLGPRSDSRLGRSSSDNDRDIMTVTITLI